MRARSSSGFILIVAVSAMVFAPVTPAHADTFDLIDGSSAGGPSGTGNIIDPVRDRIYSRKADWITVSTLDGSPVGTVTTTADPQHMALSEDGSTLYVTLFPGQYNIDVIDTATLTVTDSIDTPGATFALTVIGDRVYYAQCQAPQVSWFDVDDPDTSFDSQISGIACPEYLAARPGDPDVLYAGSSFGDIWAFDVSTPIPTQLGYHDDTLAGDFIWTIAPIPDGSGVLVGYTDGTISEFAPTDLGLVSTMTTPSGGIVRGLAATPDGSHILASSEIFTYSFPRGATEPTATWNLSLNAIVAHGTSAYGVQGITAHRIDNVESVLEEVSLTLTHAGSAVEVGDEVAFSGVLDISGSDPAAQEIEVFRVETMLGIDTTTALSSTVTDANGEYGFVDTMPSDAQLAYIVFWAGDATHPGWIDVLGVQPTKHDASLTVSFAPAPVVWGTPTVVTATLDSWWDNDEIRIYEEPAGGTKTLLSEGSVDEDGNLSVPLDPTVNTWYWVEYDGDSRNDPAEVDALMPVRVEMTGTFLKYQRRRGSVYQYDRGHSVTYAVRVAPDKTGGSVDTHLHVKTRDGWKLRESETRTIPQSGAVKISPAVGLLRAGRTYRISGNFVADGTNAKSPYPPGFFRIID